MKSALAGLPVSRVMRTDFRTLAPEDTLARAVEHILAGCQQDFPVVEGGRVVGVLTRGDLLTSLAKEGQLALVADATRLRLIRRPHLTNQQLPFAKRRRVTRRRPCDESHV